MKSKYSSPADPLQPPTLREKLWDLHLLVVESVLARLKEPMVKPVWVSLALSLLRLNEIKVGRDVQSAHAGLARLYSLSGMNTPFDPTDTNKPPSTGLNRLVKVTDDEEGQK